MRARRALRDNEKAACTTRGRASTDIKKRQARYEKELELFKTGQGQAAGAAEGGHQQRRARPQGAGERCSPRRRRKSTASTPATTKTRSATLERSQPAARSSAQRPSFLRRISFTCAGFALPLRRLHHLADQRVERLLLAGAVVRDLLRVGREHLVDQLLDRAGVGDLLQAALLDDLRRRRPSPAHIASNTPSPSCREMRAVGDAACSELSERRGATRACARCRGSASFSARAEARPMIQLATASGSRADAFTDVSK